jgi:hypothetical protein
MKNAERLIYFVNHCVVIVVMLAVATLVFGFHIGHVGWWFR